ncbi:MAG: LysM peptidoglycan-binding domain-containing protein [Rothia sp. (in: high G+C Gram-positive bacteria)]|nr:LysM peptidoglycan-binding domain-containing protein [Rothia sp. (in: high G+C Gram-positive bacteria)]
MRVSSKEGLLLHTKSLGVVIGACGIGLFSTYLALQMRDSSDALERSVVILTALVAFAIGIWWLTGYMYVLALVKKRVTHLPRWIPLALRNMAIGSMGLAVIYSPAQAAPIPVESSIAAVSATSFSDSSDFSDSSGSFVSPFFGESIEDSSMQLTSVGAENSALTAATQQTSPAENITPFFMANERLRSEPSDDPSSASTAHTVLTGETIWSIASQNLPATSDVDIIWAYCQDIQRFNQDTLTSLDEPIFPGQTINLPNFEENISTTTH